MSFHGRFALIRKTLDYSFHKKYAEDRQLFQDSVVLKFLENRPCNVPCPSLILTAGAMGAGKSHVIRHSLGERFHRYVVADVDKIKDHFPEMSAQMTENPYDVGRKFHSEACTIHEILFKEAIRLKCNVIIDGSLRNAEFFKTFLHGVDGYTVTIVHVIASLEKCLQRAIRRSKETGRIIPEESIRLSLEQCPKSVKELAPLADHVITIDNDRDDVSELFTCQLTA